MKRISKYIILAALAVIPSILGGSSAKATAESDGEKTPYVIYHDNNGTVITRDAYKSGYTFNAAFPQFYTGPEYMNTGWNTKADGKGTTYKTGEKLSDLTEDLDLYPMLEKGFYVRFDSDGGTPIQYQFVFRGGNATKPSDPKKSGYSFKFWSKSGTDTEFDFNSEITEETKLVANWNAEDSPYTVRIWLENPDRTSTTATTSDYIYTASFTKYGKTGADLVWEDSDLKNETAQKTLYSGTSPTNFQIYFCNDSYGANALTLTKADEARAKTEGGIAGDGSSILNVYFRCYVYKLKIEDKVENKVYDAFDIRRLETVGHAMERAGVTLTSKIKDYFNSKLYDVNYMYQLFYFYNNRDNQYYASEGIMSQVDICPIEVYRRESKVLTEGAKFTMQFYIFKKGKYDFYRYYYLETLDAAKQNAETGFAGHTADYKPGGSRRGNFEECKPALHIRRDVNPNGCLEGDLSYATQYFCWEINSTGNVKLEAKQRYAQFDVHASPWYLEVFYLRNRYYLRFVPNFVGVTIEDHTVPYGQNISDFKDDVVWYDGDGQPHPFVINTTEFVDDKLVKWIFKGWYDNDAFYGEPVDIETTSMTMPEENLELYAKWEKLTIEATFDGNGGKVEGKDKVKKEQQSGDIPKRPADPVPPEGMVFYCWTINGIPYDFTEPISVDTEIKALYYSNGKALKVTYNYGEGAGTVPVDSRKYLAGANPEILSPAADLVPPIGQKFSYWTDSEHHTYVPGDDFIIKDDTQLTAVYAEGDGIIIQKEGLKYGESAVFSVYDESEPTKVVNVILTGVDNIGSSVSQIVAVKFKTKNITVKELPWSWAYNASGSTEITQDITSSNGNVFTFTNVEKENAPLRDEAIKNNAIINARYGVTVNEWEKEKRNLGK